MEKKDFLKTREKILKEEGIYIFDKISSKPTADMAYNSPYYAIGINHSGSMSIDFEMDTSDFERHDVIILYPQNTIVAHESSDDLCYTVIAVSKEMYGTMSNRIIHRNRFNYVMRPKFRLTDEQYKDVMSLVEAMLRISKIKTESRHEMLTGVHEVLVQMIDDFRRENNKDEPNIVNTDSYNLSPQYHELVTKNYVQHHDVEFYANTFNLTPKHFSAIIKAETGYCASHWIHTHVVNEAKILLRSDAKLSMLEISQRVGFSDQASFSRYFKRETGLTPKDYRWKNAKKKQ